MLPGGGFPEELRSTSEMKGFFAYELPDLVMLSSQKIAKSLSRVLELARVARSDW